MASNDPAQPIMEFVEGVLSKSYNRVTAPLIAAITASMVQGIVQRSLKELVLEAEMLQNDGKPLTTSNASFRALLADFTTVMRQNALNIGSVSPGVQVTGIIAANQIARALSLPGLTDEDLERLGIGWVTPGVEAMNAQIGIAQSDEWGNELDLYTERGAAIITNQVIAGGLLNQHATTVTDNISGLINGHGAVPPLAVVQASVMLGTLQTQSYYAGTSINSNANSDIIIGQVRVSALSDTTCAACISLHGTRMEVGQPVQDHHNGLCTPVQIVIGQDEWVDNLQTGEQWLNALPEDRQLKILGPGKFDAINSGERQLSDFITTYDDPVYGTMVREAPMIEVVAGTTNPGIWR